MYMYNAKEGKGIFGTYNLLWGCMYAMYRELGTKKETHYFCKGVFQV